MSSYANVSEFINRKFGGGNGLPESYTLHKPWRFNGGLNTQPSTGKTYSLWVLDGYPGAGSPPGASMIPTRLTPGAIPFTAPSGGREKWLDYVHACNAVPGSLCFVDRLFAVSGLDKLSTSVQPIAPMALTRYTSGEGNLLFLEVYSIIGSSSTTATITYTNELGVGGRVSTCMIGPNGHREAGALVRVPLVGNDRGVRSVESIQLSGSVGGSGEFGMTILRKMTPFLGDVANATGSSRSFVESHPVKIDDDACLSMIWNAGINTSYTSLVAQVSLTER